MTTLTGYALIINEATAIACPEKLALIEECMRQDIFHSTLDWQSREELHEGAKLAVEVLKEGGEI